jgi:transposase
VKLITQSVRKNDRVDARQLARLARADAQLLSPIRHRGEEAQLDLAVIRAGAELMETRTKLINSARGLVKPLGERLKKCDADQVTSGLGESLSAGAQAVIGPLLKTVEAIGEQIGRYGEQIGRMENRYPEVKVLQQVYGVGPLIALTFVLTLDDGKRFAHSRDVGPYLGVGDQQSGRRTAAESVGTGGALHAAEEGAGKRPADVGGWGRWERAGDERRSER